MSTEKRTTITLVEPGSAITHAVAAVAALVSAPFLIGHMRDKGADPLTVFGCIVFILGMLLLYTASALYHSIPVKVEDKDNILKKLDHLMIFMLIGGTYTPLCLTSLRGTCGYVLLACVWGLSILGMIFKLFWITCPRWVSSVLYIALGWAVAFALPEVYRRLPAAGFAWLLAGGIIYTLGGILYAMECPILNTRYPNFGSHEIFHLFVMAGNLCQFITIYKYLI